MRRASNLAILRGIWAMLVRLAHDQAMTDKEQKRLRAAYQRIGLVLSEDRKR